MLSPTIPTPEPTNVASGSRTAAHRVLDHLRDHGSGLQPSRRRAPSDLRWGFPSAAPILSSAPISATARFSFPVHLARDFQNKSDGIHHTWRPIVAGGTELTHIGTSPGHDIDDILRGHAGGLS